MGYLLWLGLEDEAVGLEDGRLGPTVALAKAVAAWCEIGEIGEASAAP